MRLLIFFVFSVFTTLAGGSDPKYPVGAIPDSIRANNYGVIREKIVEYRILSRSKATYYNKEVVTILNPNGKRLTRHSVHYDPLTKLQFIRASIYDANGNLVKKIKPSEIYDHNDYGDYTLYSDSRYKTLDLSYSSYPYTFEFEYEIEQNFLYSFNNFELYEDDEVGIQKVTYALLDKRACIVNCWCHAKAKLDI
jgi:hypothetical protein